MTAYTFATEQDVTDELERLAVLTSDGCDVADQAFLLCPLAADEFEFAWKDFCTAARDRDDVAPPATRHWTEVLGEDAARTQDEAHQLLCQRADEALLVLTTGIRA